MAINYFSLKNYKFTPFKWKSMCVCSGVIPKMIFLFRTYCVSKHIKLTIPVPLNLITLHVYTQLVKTEGYLMKNAKNLYSKNYGNSVLILYK